MRIFGFTLVMLSTIAFPSLPDGVGYFRALLTLPEIANVKSAEVMITADNLFALYVNGRSAGESEVNDAWHSPKWFEISSLLVPGRNVIAVEAVNTLSGPAGLTAKLVVRIEGGEPITLASGATWKCSNEAAADALIALLDEELAEEANGWPDPLGPGVLFLHNSLTLATGPRPHGLWAILAIAGRPLCC